MGQSFGPNGFSSGRIHAGPTSGSQSTDWKLMRSKEFFHPGNSGTFTRSFHVESDFGMSRTGGAVMFMYHGWANDRAYGYVSWQNGGGADGIVNTFIHMPVTNNVTITTSHDSTATVSLNISGAHNNGHAFHFVVWSGE